MRLPVLLLLAALAAAPVRAQSYAPKRAAAHADSTRPRGALPAEIADGSVFAARVGASLSIRGLPPVDGTIALSPDSGLVFRSDDGSVVELYPVVGRRRDSAGMLARAAAVTVAAVDERGEEPVYLIRLDGAVLQTAAPGPLLELAGAPEWAEALGTASWRTSRTLVTPRRKAAMQAVVDAITSSAYADTLYALFGRPARPAGLVGERGRRAGRLGEYVRGRDSLALDPARMSTMAQLRHALAHELAHRWQRELSASLHAAWETVPPIDDPMRYGYHDRAEHQAEAAAFAVHYLQTTAGGTVDPDEAARLLRRYERFVPGTRLMVRQLLTRPIYLAHPLNTRIAAR